MGNPTLGNAINKDTYLEGIAVAYFQDENKAIADKAMPTYPVELEQGKYNVIPKEYILRTDFEARADGGQFNETEFKLSTDTYSCIEYAAEAIIGDRTAKNARLNIKAQRAKIMAGQALIKKDRVFCSTFLGTGIWATDVTGVASAPSTNQFLKFSVANSDPIALIFQYKLAVEQATGFTPNKLAISKDVFNALLNHTKVLDRMAVTGTRIASKELLRQLFDVEEIYVAGLIENTSKIGATTPAIDFISKGSMLLYYSPEVADLYTPTAGMIFLANTTEENEYGVAVYSLRDDRAHADILQMTMNYDMKVVCKDLGVFFTACI